MDQDAKLAAPDTATRADLDAGALIPLDKVKAATGLGTTSVYAKEAQGTFPKGIRLGSRCTRWRANEILAWQQDPHGWAAKNLARLAAERPTKAPAASALHTQTAPSA